MERLNKQQYRASRAEGGVSLVIAGAGTGKTRTLVEKVRNVMRDPSLEGAEFLVLTFSRKAAAELRERIGGTSRVTAGTFHSFCLGLLRDNADILAGMRGVAGFPGVIDDEERTSIIRSLARVDLRRFRGLPARMACEFLDRLDSFDPSERERLEAAGLRGELDLLREEFIAFKREQNLIDYGDMIDLATAMLDQHHGVREALHARYRFVFVDEFQDVAPDNVRLLKLILPEGGGNLFAVGDDWQSIYGFRGASVDYIVRMRRHFPGSRVHRLTVNYRSRREIVTLSNGFIRNNRFRTRKRLRSHPGRGGRVRLHAVETPEEEAGIVRGVLASGSPGRTLAVLYRNNWQGRFLERLCGPGGECPGVHFMTMHASKGLEFDVVVVAGVADSIIPDPDNDIEEERRLLYVACTRAREELHVIARLNERGEVSRFGRELGLIRSPGFPRNRRRVQVSNPPTG
ncbi:MAG: UvrD-helicase domain-containing protein [Spirochaetes bacterium]|nr:UvrD-helicase domain-containing protein [Spirochaetota bacterium]